MRHRQQVHEAAAGAPGPAFQACRSPSPCSGTCHRPEAGGRRGRDSPRDPAGGWQGQPASLSATAACSYPRRRQSPRFPSLLNFRCASNRAPPTSRRLLGWKAGPAQRKGVMPSVSEPNAALLSGKLLTQNTQCPLGPYPPQEPLALPIKQETDWRVHGVVTRWESGFPRGWPQAPGLSCPQSQGTCTARHTARPAWHRLRK